jgi:hypothetical protein
VNAPLLTDEEKTALAVLARRNRILAIIVPVGVPDDEVKQLAREVNARLEDIASARIEWVVDG